MTTVLRTNPLTGETRAFTEYTPAELDDIRLKRETRQMLATGRHKSSHGAVDASAFVPDTGAKTLRHKAHA